MLVERNLVRPVANGEVYLFSAVSAVYLYLFRTQNGLSSSAESLFRFFVGGDENPKRSLTPRSLTDSVGPHQERHGANNVTSQQREHPSNGSKAKLVGRTILRRLPLVEGLVREVQGQVTGWVKYLEGLARHRCCPHENSCLSYVIKGGTKMFTIGFLVQATLSSVSVINSIIKKPSTLKNTIFNRLNLKLAAFLGGYSAIFRAVNCILRWVRNKDTPVNGFIAGGLAGLTLRFYRSVTIALYAATKLVEILYFKGIESYGFPYIKCADIFIYAFSTAFIFHAAVMEPHTLRPGYWKFLLRVTDNKFALMNRQLLDVFGANSSKIKPDYWPDYDPAFTTLTRPKS
ncbi:transmembrane protein 135-like [Physella acuta]|uniref:transmembrane protein 135-like n=1 Tax=Physella acuta TaxID=109671 RepID=UPI0027DB0E4B|nr:transmembrane protein 135-like [Physella acuta]